MVKHSVVEATEHYESDWDRYVCASKHASGYHLMGWRRVIRRTFGHETDYLLVKDDSGRLKGVLPLVLLSSKLFGRFMVSLPFLNYGGVVAEDSAAAASLLDAAIERAQTRGAQHIELRQGAASDIALPSSHRKVSMRLDLPSGYEELWKAFPSKLRSQIRRAQREGMTVRFGGIECVSNFYNVFCRCMRDLGTPVYSQRFFRAICEEFPSQSRICLVALDGLPVAAGFLYGFRSVLEIPWAASDKRFSRMAPNMLLYSSILEHACQKQYQAFDFGRSSPDTGTYRFKEQWGAAPHQLHWYYWTDGQEVPQLNPQNPKFEFAIRAWKKLPLSVANLLGPHIVKYLP